VFASKGLLANADKAKSRKFLISFQHISVENKILYTDAMHDVNSSAPERPRTALLLIAHGSREVEANADLFHVVAEMRRRCFYNIVEASFLELAEPTVEQAGARCAEQGAQRVILLPYFLSAGIHVQRDLTALCARLSSRHPEVTFALAEPLGRHPLLVEVLVDRARLAEQKMAAGE
jgi:sirohydrochlorin ferrochelatase